MKKPVLMIVGATAGSLGSWLCRESWRSNNFSDIVTAGITEEQYIMDACNYANVRDTLGEVNPDVLICTVGHNTPTPLGYGLFEEKLNTHYMMNLVGPVTLLREMAFRAGRREPETGPGKFVAISSNSARIARTNSLPYCATKAALSMAVRCAAREYARDGVRLHSWVYEPGLLADTPMTRAMRGTGKAMHRMEGVASEGLSPQMLARYILGDVMADGRSQALNGTCVPFDAGEQ